MWWRNGHTDNHLWSLTLSYTVNTQNSDQRKALPSLVTSSRGESSIIPKVPEVFDVVIPISKIYIHSGIHQLFTHLLRASSAPHTIESLFVFNMYAAIIPLGSVKLTGVATLFIFYSEFSESIRHFNRWAVWLYISFASIQYKNLEALFIFNQIPKKNGK